jgi:hypothetical protein
MVVGVGLRRLSGSPRAGGALALDASRGSFAPILGLSPHLDLCSRSAGKEDASAHMSSTSAGAVSLRHPAAYPRLCHCGCRRSLEGRRADCRFYNGTCRKQYLRDRAKALQDVPRRCRCGPGALHTLDPADGDVSCQKCGRVVGHLTALVGYCSMKALMIRDVDGRPRRPARKRPERQRDWRDFQPFQSPVIVRAA